MGEPSDAVVTTSSKWPGVIRAFRLVLAALIAAGLLGYVIASHHWSRFQTCGEALPENATSPVTVCTAVPATSASVLLGVLLIVLLLLPDFAEVAIPGLVSLKRQVKEQAQKHRELEIQLQHVSAQASSHVTNQVLLGDRATLEALARGVPSGQIDDSEAEPEPPLVAEEQPQLHDVHPVADEEAVALLARELIERWERLARAARLAETLSARQGDVSGIDAPSARGLVDWWTTYREQLQYVQAARNSVAHALPLDTDTLESVVSLAQSLEDALPEIAIYDGSDLHMLSLQFDRRLRGWLAIQGITVLARTTRKSTLFDFVARDPDGRMVVIESKVARRKITRATLADWVATLQERGESQYPGARMILAISCPGFVRSALEYATTAPAEIYWERRPADFERLST